MISLIIIAITVILNTALLLGVYVMMEEKRAEKELSTLREFATAIKAQTLAEYQDVSGKQEFVAPKEADELVEFDSPDVDPGRLLKALRAEQEKTYDSE